MKKLQHLQSATPKNCSTKECNKKNVHMEIMQRDRSATKKECNTKKVQHKKTQSEKKCNMTKNVARVKCGKGNA